MIVLKLESKIKIKHVALSVVIRPAIKERKKEKNRSRYGRVCLVSSWYLKKKKKKKKGKMLILDSCKSPLLVISHRRSRERNSRHLERFCSLVASSAIGTTLRSVD